MLSSTCSLFITAVWTRRMRDWMPFLSEDDVTSIVTSLDVGAFLAILPGTLYDTWGCKPVGYVGAALTLVGYLGMYVAVTVDDIAGVTELCVLGFIIGQGSIWLVICALNCVTANFEAHDRGRAVGLIMTAFGLSSGIFNQVAVAYEGPNVRPELFIVLGVGISSAAVLANMGIFELPHNTPSSARDVHMNWILGVNTLLVVAVAGPSFLAADFLGTNLWAIVVLGTYAAALVLQAAIVAGVIGRYGLLAALDASMLPRPDLSMLAKSEGEESTRGAASRLRRKVALMAPHVKFAEALAWTEYWLLVVIFAVAVGVGQMVTNSLAEIDEMDPVVGVSIFSAGNSVGRFLPGYLSDFLFRHFDRASFLLVAVATLCVSQMVLLASNGSSVCTYVGVFLTACAFGAFWVLVPALEAEWFGRADFGKIHGALVAIGGGAGVLLLYKGNCMLSEATVGPCKDESRDESCFQLNWTINLATSTAALLAALVVKLLNARGGRVAHLLH